MEKHLEQEGTGGDRVLPRRSSRENIGVPPDMYGSWVTSRRGERQFRPIHHSTVVGTGGISLHRTMVSARESESASSQASRRSRVSIRSEVLLEMERKVEEKLENLTLELRKLRGEREEIKNLQQEEEVNTSQHVSEEEEEDADDESEEAFKPKKKFDPHPVFKQSSSVPAQSPHEKRYFPTPAPRRRTSAKAKPSQPHSPAPMTDDPARTEAKKDDVYVKPKPAEGEKPVPAPRKSKLKDVDTLSSALIQTILAQGKNTERFVARQSVDSKLPMFSGNPLEWPAFERFYRQTNLDCGFSNFQNWNRLQKSLQGEAKMTVQALMIVIDNAEKVMEALKKRFGRPEYIIQALIDLVRKTPAPKENKLETVIHYSSAVQNLVTTVETLKEDAHMQNPELLRELVEKLPESMKLLWGQQRRRIGAVTLREFAAWIEEMSDAASLVTTPKFEQKSVKAGKSGDRVLAATTTPPTENPSTSSSPSNPRRKCASCSNEDHGVGACPEFQKMDVAARIAVVKTKGLCFRCLRYGHSYLECRSKALCRVPGCGRRHHTMLHQSKEEFKPKTAEASSQVRNVNGHVQERCSSEQAILLRVLPITLYGEGTEMTINALLDEASTVTILSEEVAVALKLEGKSDPLRFTWTDGSSQQHVNSRKVECFAGPVGEKLKFKMKNVRTVPTLELPAALAEVEQVTGVFPHLQSQHFKVLPKEKPKILIGQAHIHLTVAREIIEGGDDAPVLTKTRLGWVLHGPITGKEASHSSFSCQHESDDDLLSRLLKESYNVDVGIGVTKPARSRDDKLAEEKMTKITSRVGDRWQTGLLWRSEDTKLPPSYDAAFRRLLGVERRFKRDPELRREYEEKMIAYIEKGYARVLSPEEAAIPSDVEWYLPHFATTHPNKPGKIRIVLDAASRSKGVCLNDKLLTGPDLLVSLHGLLLKFRRKRVGFMGDITEMFHQVRIRRDDCPAQRILWRADQNQPPDIIQIEVMIFGSVCSPFSAQYVKNLNASEFSIQYPAAAHAILTKHYMDDYLDCCDDEKEAVQLANDVAAVHSKGGFEIGKWSSNSPTFLQKMGVAPSNQVHDLSKWSEIQTERVLGLHWSPEADAFTFRVNLERAGAGIATGEKIPTKREILRLVMLLWDPLGFFAHFTIKAKVLLQHLWRKKLGWDDELPVNLFQSWRKWVQLLPKMREFVLPRMYSPFLRTSSNIQLHIFADSSEVAYCSVGFLRTSHKDGESYDVSFIFAKCRVAPLKPCSIPRLELQAALLASRIGKFATEELEIPIHKIYYWTDSMTTLRRIRSDARRFTQFVANRVGEIQENSSIDDWRWVPTKENPADLGTREGSTDLSLSSSWWRGPKYLYLPSSEWPQEPSRCVEEELELKRDFIAVAVSVPEWSLPDCTRFSNYVRLVRATAYILKFIDVARKLPSSNGPLPVKRAEQFLLQRCQWESYPNEMKILESMKTLPPSSPLFQLSPFLDHNGVLRMKSRLATVQDEGVRLPIILHPKCYLTKLLIQYYHKMLQHQGEDMIRNEMRQVYWIPRLRVAVRNVIRSCGECRLRKIKNVQPRMGDLPDIRVQPQPRPFTITGMDYFGPMEVTHGRKHEKRYGVLFTCLSTRAVHLEVAHSLTTDSCIMSIRRFIGRRGQPKEIHSDNGTNLRGADKELRLALTELDQGEIEDDLSVRGIQWHFLPPAAPNMAGVWERLVRSVKVALSVILKSRFPKDEVLRTVFAEAEAIVNSRPLVDVPVDPESPEALTPSHFLIGTSSSSQPTGDFMEKEADLGKLWRQTQALADMFWRRWIREYLPTLQRRAKWHGSSPNVEVGDVVVVLDESLRRGTWPLGKVLKVFPGKDGVVRVVEVQTVTGIYRRPVTKLGKLDVKASPET